MVIRAKVVEQMTEFRGGENDEARMTNDEGMTKRKWELSCS